MPLTGESFVGSARGARTGTPVYAINPANGKKLEPAYFSASADEVNRAVELASAAFPVYSQTDGKTRAAFLRAVADGLDAIKEPVAERAHLETALPMPRLLGEMGRTTGQLRIFASVIEEGSWVEARIDSPLPERKPLPRSDLRSMLRALGPVVVFGASNFPLAFSAAGGDTASALAAGCPVIVKAHPAHPGTSEMVAEVFQKAIATCGLPEGVFSLLYDAGTAVGTVLVRHPLVQAVAFTGSFHGGRALMDLAAARPQPIPCFMEMSSGNPVFLLPSALRKGADSFAQGLFNSFTLGAGQFCTKPGMIFVPEQREAEGLLEKLKQLVSDAQPFTLLTPGIAKSYAHASGGRALQASVAAQAPAAVGDGCLANAQLFVASLEEFLKTPQLAEEIFGPDTLLVRCSSPEEYLKAAASLDGHLTATLWGDEADLRAHRELIAVLEQKAGRLIFNGFPTGVEVCHAMVHGGPYPSTSDSRFTSVGTRAIFRFARPVCFQDFPDALVPAELQAANPLGILRMVDGEFTRKPIG
jgi:2,5-dioxopentanoate dehydrogenase